MLIVKSVLVISVYHMGAFTISCVNHVSVSCAVKQTTYFGAYFTKDNDYSVTKGEIGFKTFLIEHSIPFSVADHATKLFHKIFPDSAIAKKYACSRTKTSKLVEILFHV